jgi:hypothetical protein
MYMCWQEVVETESLHIFMFCWACIIVYQYNETSVMHFPFNLLRIKGLYMFRALLAHPQEALQTAFSTLRVYNVSWLWHGCSELHAIYQMCFCAAPPEDEQVILETCKGSWFSINWVGSASRSFRFIILIKQLSLLWCRKEFVYNCTCVDVINNVLYKEVTEHFVFCRTKFQLQLDSDFSRYLAP